MGMLQAQNIPWRCPCCWPTKGLVQPSQYEADTVEKRGGCVSCMPLVATIDAPNDWLSYDGLTCRGWDTVEGVTDPTYTPKLNASWGTPSGVNSQWFGVFLSEILEHPDGVCTAQYGQYCIDDDNGNQGRAWVVELWIWDGSTLTTLTTTVRDWECRCYDSTWGSDGARFEWSLTGDIPDCASAPSCECTAGTCLQATIPAYNFSIGMANYIYAGGTIQMPSYTDTPVKRWLSFDGTTRVQCDVDGALGCAAGQFQLSFGGVKWCCDTCTGTFTWLPQGGETGTTPGDATVIECP